MAFQSCRPEDFEAFVKRHENKIYRTALAVMGSVFDAEDVVQETFLRAYTKSPEFESEHHARAWLIRVTVNLCNSALRNPWRGRTQTLLDVYPAREGEQQVLLEHVLALPPKYRAVLHLFYYEGYSVHEISTMTGQREGTVRSILTRGRDKLKTLIKEDNDVQLS